MLFRSFNKIKLVGIVVIFSPSDDQILNITKLASGLNLLIVVDNTESEVGSLKSCEFPDNVQILINGNLGGIAGALNLGIKRAIALVGECVLFLLDQDSCLPNKFFRNQYAFAVHNNKKIVAPKYYDINSKTYGNYTKLKKWTIVNIMGDKATEPFEVTFAITSGTLIFSSLFKEIGFFREDYFIDHVDSEFCVRLQKHGYYILINTELIFDHAIGKRILKKFCGINFKPNFHPPIRRYYAVRNSLFMIFEYYKIFPSIIWLIFLRIGYEYLGIILFENNKIVKLKALIFGIWDGLNFRSGKCKRSF